ncbi:MAG: hypothetical protein R8G66_13560 [Cytophagales bacterium]|nr:hypothetical protein [Cytophagales bacterium]
MITEDQEQVIIDDVESSKIRNQSLKEDLIDHLCCMTEIQMDKGSSFEDALKVAMVQTAPNGLNEIEKETIFLLNYSKIIFMKRLTYLSGYLFSVTWIAGVLFKILHLPGASMMLSIGGLGLAFIFFPLLLINRYKSIARQVLSERLKWILGAITLGLLIISISMKMLHFMGAGEMLALSFLVFGFGFLPFFFFRMYKKSVDEL